MTFDLIDQMFMDHEESLAPGVQGVVFFEPGAMIVNWLRAEHEGAGDVGRYLDALPTNATVKVIGVTSERLAGMLERRGFRQVLISLPSGDGWVEAHVRRADA